MQEQEAGENEEVERIHLPGKLRNEGRIRRIGEVQILLNGYEMLLNQAVPEVNQFRLSFAYERPSKEGRPPEVKPLEKGPRNDESKETRRRLLWALFHQLIDQHPEIFGDEPKKFVWDCATALYSPLNLGLQKGESIDVNLAVNRDALEERCRAYIRNMVAFHVNLLRTDVVINLQTAAPAYMEGDDTVVTFLELLSSQQMFEKENHFCFNNRFYNCRENFPLRDVAPILKRGMQKNVRFVGDSKEDAQPILQLYPKKSAFFPSGKVIDFLCAFLTPRGRRQPIEPGELARQLENPSNKQRAHSQIKGVVVQTTHLEADRQITFANAGFHDQPVSATSFPNREGEIVGVVEHYRRVYNHHIRYDALPCLIKRTPQGDSYFPMEVLEICDGQLVPREKQTSTLTEQMIKECQILPINVPRQIEEQRDAAFIQNTNPFFSRQHGFDVRVKTDQIRAKASLLFPPAIQYEPRQESVQPNQQGAFDWKMSGRRAYIQPAEWPLRWAIVIVQNIISEETCRRFIGNYVETARNRGLTGCSTEAPVRVQWDYFEDTKIEYVEERFKYYKDKRCGFVLVFAEGKRNGHSGDIHHILKLMEQRYSIVTQHISREVVNSATPMKLDNLLFKTNLKLGGINWSLVTSNEFKRASGNPEDVMANVWLASKRMFIGLDWSHAPPQSLFSRQKGKVPAIPTFIGMAYTTGKQVLGMRGTYWCQQTRKTTITEEYMRPFMDNIKEALGTYEEENGHFPEHLIIYRSGASEGEFKRIAYWEGLSFKEAFREIINERPGQNLSHPAITIVVCQRQSNYKIVPVSPEKRAKAQEQNVQPGTVLDKGFMNAALTEFLLVGHKAFQGTAQPVRCTVVLDHRPDSGPASRLQRIPLDELENITYALCYSHGICCMPTALPGPLHEAGDLSKRGKNNWNTLTNQGEQGVRHFDIPRNEGDADAIQQDQRRLDQEKREYFGETSELLKPNLPTKYWA